MIDIHFGLCFDENVYQKHTNNSILGPKKCFAMLQDWFGLAGEDDDNEFLRVEKYRQILKDYLINHANAFYRASFEADALSTANVLLQRRDELKLVGFDFIKTPSLPERLMVWAEIEELLLAQDGLPRGMADIFEEIISKIPEYVIPINSIYLYDKLEDLPFHWQRLFLLILDKNTHISLQIKSIEQNFVPKEGSDLGMFQKKISSNNQDKAIAKIDGSLLIVKAKREYELLEWLAKIKLLNPSYHPLCLIPETNRALDAAFVMESQPALGIASSSSARPALQLLKLVTVFLWRPIDPHRILEFLSLPQKPIDDRLAMTIAQIIAEKPGLYSQLWGGRLNEFWQSLEKKVSEGKSIDIQAIRNQYEFWFDRKRYDLSQRVPKNEVIALFDYLSKWAVDAYMLKKTPSLLVLATQAEKISELIAALKERDLSYLELDRIIRTIYKPSPVVLEAKQVESVEYIHKEGAFAAEVAHLTWLNFIEKGNTVALGFWRKDELGYLRDRQIFLEDKSKENRVALTHLQRPILACKEQLVLLIPATINGKETVEHPLMGYLHATFSNLNQLVFDLNESSEQTLASFFTTPVRQTIPQLATKNAQVFIEIEDLHKIQTARSFESLTSLEDLLYYPYKWAFRYKAKLANSAILSIAKDNKLMGNLAHRAFELMLRENFTKWSQQSVNQWINDTMPDIMFKEGATLLMYGKEQEREMFLNKLKYAAWSLISMINQNGWSVIATEQALEGTFQDTPIKAKADLILERKQGEYAIVDLKWSGITNRKNMLNNLEDLQLVMYAALLEQTQVPYTAYFIIDKGKMLARTNSAFKEAEIINKTNADISEIHHFILKRMKMTFDWRKQQLQDGKIEVRTSSTILDLERYYEQHDTNLIEMLEMKHEDARWDDFGVLVRGNGL
jgi:ATP-dependent helicase/nuclease subunit B